MRDLPGICDQLLSASVNGVCQGILLAGLVFLGLRATGRTNAATRHAILFFTLLLLVALMVPHWTGASFRLARSENNKVDRGSAPVLDTSKWSIEEEAVPGAPVLQEELSQEFPYDTAQAPDLDVARNVLKVSPPVSELGTEASVTVAASRTPFLENLRRLASRLVNPMSVEFGIPKHAGIYLMIVCVAVIMIKVLVLLFRLAQIRNLKLNSIIPGNELSDLFQRLRKRQGAARDVTLRISREIKAPLFLGFFHPLILLPAELAEEAKQSDTEQVLRHELAHLRRCDDWANLVQHLIQAFLFFHPAVWWISRQLSLDREIACDDHVLEQSGRRAYAFLLANLAGRMRGYPPLAPGTSGNKNQLKQRIDMVLDSCRNNSPHLARMRVGCMTTAAALFAAAAICYAPRLALAQNEPTQEPQDLRPPSERSPRDESGPFVVPLPPAFPPGPRMNRGDLPRIAGQPQPPGAPRMPRAPIVRSLLEDREGNIWVGTQPGFGPGERPLEERLARLERMVQTLMSHFDLNPGEGDFHGKARTDEEVIREKMPGPHPYPRSTGNISRGRQIIMGKLDRIRLDKGWDGLPLSEVIKDLGNESRKRDPDKRGINFIINPNVSTAAPAIDPATGLPIASGAPAEPVDVGATLIKINPVLTDVSLADLLDAIVKVADHPIKYSIEDYAVVFSVKSADNLPMGFGRRLREQDRDKLNAQFEMLEREKRKLSQQIEKLQKEQEKLEQSSKEKPGDR